MKLFGGKADGSHTAHSHEAPAGAQRTNTVRRFRVPLIVLGCVVVLALAAVIGYSIWEKPPETVKDGPTVIATPKPAVTDMPIATKAPSSANQQGEDPNETQPPEPTETPEPTPTPAPAVRRDGCYTFLLMAKDQGGGNTDAIIVGRLDTAAGTLDMVNIPRDTLVNVSWDVKKANTIYSYERGDMERVKEHISRVVGFTVDSYALLNLNAIALLVDSIGGVTFNVPVNMDYDDPTQDLHIHYQKGEQYLSGADVVKVLRFRQGNEDVGYYNGDLGRIETQQKLLRTLASQLLTLGNISNLDNFAQIIHDNIKTDLEVSNIAFYLRSFLQLKKENLSFYTAPGDGVMIRSGAYYALEPEGWLEIVNKALNPYDRDLTSENIDVLQVLGPEEIVSTSGASIPITSFLDFRTLNY